MKKILKRIWNQDWIQICWIILAGNFVLQMIFNIIVKPKTSWFDLALDDLLITTLIVLQITAKRLITKQQDFIHFLKHALENVLKDKMKVIIENIEFPGEDFEQPDKKEKKAVN